MLKLPNPIVSDSKAHRIITKHISEQVLDLLKQVIADCTMEIEEFDEMHQEFIGHIRDFFPDNFPKEKMGEVFYGLYVLLDSEEEYVPSVVMEYLMARLLEAKIRIPEEEKSTLQVQLENDREYVIEHIRRELTANDEIKEFEDEETAVEYSMQQIECMENYMETCFWDVDYQLLDTFTEKELIQSGINERFGIGLEERE